MLYFLPYTLQPSAPTLVSPDRPNDVCDAGVQPDRAGCDRRPLPPTRDGRPKRRGVRVAHLRRLPTLQDW